MIERWSNRAPRVPVAWLALVHDKRRTMTALAGVTFAVLFMFLQLGFLGAAKQTAVSISDHLDADLLLVSNRYVHLMVPGGFSRQRLLQALADPEVTSAVPLLARWSMWRRPEMPKASSAVILGVRPDLGGLRLAAIEAQRAVLTMPRSALVDTLHQPKVGPIDLGASPEVRGKKLQIVGHFTMGIGFLGDIAVVVSDRTFNELVQGDEDEVHFGLLKLASGADPRVVRDRLAPRLPKDTRVLLPSELAEVQRAYWVDDTAVGQMFSMGTVIGFIVGIVVLFQLLSAEVGRLIPGFAMLKAIGFTSRRLYAYVVQQALFFAFAGVLLAFPLAVKLYDVIAGMTKLPLSMTLGRAVAVLLLTGAMCASTGFMAARRIGTADPAELL